jgi:hypothetical protein
LYNSIMEYIPSMLVIMEYIPCILMIIYSIIIDLRINTIEKSGILQNLRARSRYMRSIMYI